MFNQIHTKSQSVYQKVVSELKLAIVNGQLKPGEKLPNQRELAEMLGVSRTTLREALKLLEASGLVVIKHGQGVYVTDKDPNTPVDTFVQQLFIGKEKIEELFAIRRVLEVQAAIWAAKNGTEEQKQELLKIVAETTDALESKGIKDKSVLLAEHDRIFHNALAEATNNSVFVKIMHDLIDLLTDARCQATRVPNRPVKSLRDHLKIAQAIIKGDTKEAKNTMLEHLDAVEKDLMDSIE
ncbi:GntR family transcriptional repressor for pyruvate dehydrogenase complex [Desulfitispora alkaliphila]|uniref:FadR/GntR family transcriptional regulator n=1 Tax=Desulfitispora alkaliphila TaxID=622674 RepID=UPI003D1DB520